MLQQEQWTQDNERFCLPEGGGQLVGNAFTLKNSRRAEDKVGTGETQGTPGSCTANDKGLDRKSTRHFCYYVLLLSH